MSVQQYQLPPLYQPWYQLELQLQLEKVLTNTKQHLQVDTKCSFITVAGSQNTVVAVSVSVTLATIICLVVVYQWKLKQKAKLQQQLTNNFMDIQTVLTLTSPIKTHSQEWEIPQHHVKLISSLGQQCKLPICT
jgi:hypothetical protein